MRRATQCCARRVAAGTPSRSTLSVLRTARRPLSDGSGGAVRFAEIKEMPEAVRAVERETDVVDGAPLFVEREATRRVVEALERRAANPDEGDGLDADADGSSFFVFFLGLAPFSQFSLLLSSSATSPLSTCTAATRTGPSTRGRFATSTSTSTSGSWTATTCVLSS